MLSGGRPCGHPSKGRGIPSKGHAQRTLIELVVGGHKAMKWKVGGESRGEQALPKPNADIAKLTILQGVGRRQGSGPNGTRSAGTEVS